MTARHLTPHRRGATRLATVLTASILAALASIGFAGRAEAASGPIATQQRTYCYVTNGVGRAQVPAPGVQPMPYIAAPGTVLVGDNTQRVVYRPYVERWTGSTWAVVGYGPTFTGTTGQLYNTWNQSGGLWTASIAIDVRTQKHYRFGAEIVWLADAHHFAGDARGLGEHLQLRGGTWYWANYCSF